MFCSLLEKGEELRNTDKVVLELKKAIQRILFCATKEGGCKANLGKIVGKMIRRLLRTQGNWERSSTDNHPLKKGENERFSEWRQRHVKWKTYYDRAITV